MHFTIPASTGIVNSDKTITVDKGATRKFEPKVRKATFGDGYSQTLPDGINNISEKLNITFSPRERQEIDEIEAYFSYLKGSSTLSLTIDNLGTSITIKTRVTDWNQRYSYDNFYSLTASLERVYEP